jgi:hypothetical protein
MELFIRTLAKVSALIGFDLHVARVPSSYLPDYVAWDKDDTRDVMIFSFRKRV